MAERNPSLHILQHALATVVESGSPTSFEIVRRNGDVHIVLVDADDYYRVMDAGPWHVLSMKAAKTLYVRRTVRADGQQAVEGLHRFLLTPVEKQSVDHINGNGLDNRRANLRLSTSSENGRNRGLNRNNTSGFKGVVWHGPSGLWRAEIMVNRKRTSLGYHSSADLAHNAYCRAAAELHGPFANGGG